MDERFFMYAEEADLCQRIRSAGWEVRHLPSLTVLHYGVKAGVDPHIKTLPVIGPTSAAVRSFADSMGPAASSNASISRPRRLSANSYTAVV